MQVIFIFIHTIFFTTYVEQPYLHRSITFFLEKYLVQISLIRRNLQNMNNFIRIYKYLSSVHIFLPIGQALTLSTYFKITEVALKLGIFSIRKNQCQTFIEKYFGLHFGGFFHKLIWSRCFEPTTDS
jgi:hypothetical protein